MCGSGHGIHLFLFKYGDCARRRSEIDGIYDEHILRGTVPYLADVVSWCGTGIDQFSRDFSHEMSVDQVAATGITVLLRFAARGWWKVRHSRRARTMGWNGQAAQVFHTAESYVSWSR